MDIAVSVIIPIYNVEKYVERCLLSVMDQTLKNIEIICIDDCSSDASISIVEMFAKQDERIVIIRNDENMGQAFSRNVGLKKSNGEYIFFLDSDDFIEEDALEKLFVFARNKKLDMLEFGFLSEYEDEDLKKKIKYEKTITEKIDSVKGTEYFIRELSEGRLNAAICSFFYNREFLMLNKLMFKNNIIFEDNLFFYNAIMKADKVGRIVSYPYHYCRRNGSTTVGNDDYSYKLYSLCIISQEINNDIANEKNVALLKAKLSFKRRIDKEIAFNYRMIPYFEEKDKERLLSVIMPLSYIQAFKYGSFFPWKLTKQELDLIKKYDSVLLYGAGKVGKGLEELLHEYGLYNLEFVVTKNDNGNNLCEISDWKGNKDNILIIIAAKEQEELLKNAKKNGFKNIMTLLID